MIAISTITVVTCGLCCLVLYDDAGEAFTTMACVVGRGLGPAGDARELRGGLPFGRDRPVLPVGLEAPVVSLAAPLIKSYYRTNDGTQPWGHVRNVPGMGW